MHAREANHYGPVELPLCAPVTRMPRWDQRFAPFEDPGAPAPCERPLISPATDDAVLQQTLATMRRYNIFGVLGGAPPLVDTWVTAGEGRFIPSLDLRFDPETATPRTTTPAGTPWQLLPVDSIRAHFAAGRFAVLAEVMNQYAGIAPDDPRLEPLWAMAAELDIPVGIHLGGGGPAEPYVGAPNYRARLSSALTLEDVLVRHPTLRVFIMHAGYPLVDDLKALLFTHPQVYVELSMAVNVETRPAFYRFLRDLVESGYGDRIMFGSDQMIWPGLIDAAVAGIEGADFLTAAQKRDIFYNNAARFLRLSAQDIAAHHRGVAP